MSSYTVEGFWNPGKWKQLSLQRPEEGTGIRFVLMQVCFYVILIWFWFRNRNFASLSLLVLFYPRTTSIFLLISLLAEPLLLRVVENRDRNPSSLSIARSSKFVQLSLRRRKSSLFKVQNSVLYKPQIYHQNDLQMRIDFLNQIFMSFQRNTFVCKRFQTHISFH